MNLAGAKTALIYAFLGLNLFLCYQLFWDGALNLTRLAVTHEQVESTREKLEKAGYYLDTALDRSMQSSAFLTVRPSITRVREAARRTAGQARSKTGETGIVHYDGAEAEVLLYPGGNLQVVFKTPVFLTDGCLDMDEDKLLFFVEQFLLDREMKPEGFKYDYTKKDATRITLHYYQVYDNMPLFAGYIKVYLINDRVTGVDMFVLEPEEWSLEKKMEVIPVTEALLRLAEELGPSPSPCHLVKADLGFFSREYDAEKWEVPPVWRFLTRGGKNYYINAFTGNMESD